MDEDTKRMLDESISKAVDEVFRIRELERFVAFTGQRMVKSVCREIKERRDIRRVLP